MKGAVKLINPKQINLGTLNVNSLEYLVTQFDLDPLSQADSLITN